jgi:prevent-host-death family protein
MREIGVRELKRSLSETLRAVSRGQQVRVTMRGRPIADIVPAGASSGDDLLRKLVADGRLVAPTHPRATNAPRLAKRTGARSASSLVLAERDEER